MKTHLPLLGVLGVLCLGCNPNANVAKNLKSSDSGDRAKAAQQLADQGAQIPKLVEMAVEDEDRTVQLTAASGLANMTGESQTRALQLLVKRFDDMEPTHRANAVEAVGKFRSNAKAAVDDCAKLLKDDDAKVRAAAARALGQIGADASKTLPDLLVALEDEEGKVGVAVLGAVHHLGVHKEAESAIVKACMHSDEDVRRAALTALSTDREIGRRNISTIAECLTSESPEVVKSAVSAITFIGPGTEPALPALREARERFRGNYDVNRMLGDAIGRLERAVGKQKSKDSKQSKASEKNGEEKEPADKRPE